MHRRHGTTKRATRRESHKHQVTTNPSRVSDLFQSISPRAIHNGHIPSSEVNARRSLTYHHTSAIPSSTSLQRRGFTTNTSDKPCTDLCLTGDSSKDSFIGARKVSSTVLQSSSSSHADDISLPLHHIHYAHVLPRHHSLHNVVLKDHHNMHHELSRHNDEHHAKATAIIPHVHARHALAALPPIQGSWQDSLLVSTFTLPVVARYTTASHDNGQYHKHGRKERHALIHRKEQPSLHSAPATTTSGLPVPCDTPRDRLRNSLVPTSVVASSFQHPPLNVHPTHQRRPRSTHAALQRAFSTALATQQKRMSPLGQSSTVRDRSHGYSAHHRAGSPHSQASRELFKWVPKPKQKSVPIDEQNLTGISSDIPLYSRLRRKGVLYDRLRHHGASANGQAGQETHQESSNTATHTHAASHTADDHRHGTRKPSVISLFRITIQSMVANIKERFIPSDEDSQMTSNTKSTIISGLVAVSGNTLVCIAKLIAAIMTNSGVMLAEALHSLADVANQMLLMIGMQQSVRKPDEQHPYGWGQARFVYAIASATGVFFIGCVLSLYHAFQQLLDQGHTVDVSQITAYVLAFSILVEGFSGFVALKVINKLRKEQRMGFIEYIRKGQDTTAIAIFIEDFVAMVGLLTAVASSALTYHFHNAIFDTLGTGIVGISMGFVAYFLFQRNLAMLLGHSFSPKERKEIVEVLRQRPGVRSIHDLKTVSYGESDYRVKAEIQFDGRQLAKQVLHSPGITPEALTTEIEVQPGSPHHPTWPWPQPHDPNIGPQRVKVLRRVLSDGTVAGNTIVQLLQQSGIPPQRAEDLLFRFGTDVVDEVGREVDVVEKLIKTHFPYVTHVDLEAHTHSLFADSDDEGLYPYLKHLQQKNAATGGHMGGLTDDFHDSYSLGGDPNETDEKLSEEYKTMASLLAMHSGHGLLPPLAGVGSSSMPRSTFLQGDQNATSPRLSTSTGAPDGLQHQDNDDGKTTSSQQANAASGSQAAPPGKTHVPDKFKKLSRKQRQRLRKILEIPPLPPPESFLSNPGLRSPSYPPLFSPEGGGMHSYSPAPTLSPYLINPIAAHYFHHPASAPLKQHPMASFGGPQSHHFHHQHHGLSHGQYDSSFYGAPHNDQSQQPGQPRQREPQPLTRDGADADPVGVTATTSGASVPPLQMKITSEVVKSLEKQTEEQTPTSSNNSNPVGSLQADDATTTTSNEPDSKVDLLSADIKNTIGNVIDLTNLEITKNLEISSIRKDENGGQDEHDSRQPPAEEEYNRQYQQRQRQHQQQQQQQYQQPPSYFTYSYPPPAIPVPSPLPAMGYNYNYYDQQQSASSHDGNGGLSPPGGTSTAIPAYDYTHTYHHHPYGGANTSHQQTSNGGYLDMGWSHYDLPSGPKDLVKVLNHEKTFSDHESDAILKDHFQPHQHQQHQQQQYRQPMGNGYQQFPSQSSYITGSERDDDAYYHAHQLRSWKPLQTESEVEYDYTDDGGARFRANDSHGRGYAEQQSSASASSSVTTPTAPRYWVATSTTPGSHFQLPSLTHTAPSNRPVSPWSPYNTNSPVSPYNQPMASQSSPYTSPYSAGVGNVQPNSSGYYFVTETSPSSSSSYSNNTNKQRTAQRLQGDDQFTKF